MILLANQAKRFYRLWDLFIAFAAKRLDAPGAHSRLGVTDETSLDIQHTLWGTGAGAVAGKAHEIIDDYVTRNPDRLGNADLRTIRGWENAINDKFGVVRDGRDVLFLFGSHAFGVRGITREIDDMTGPLPAFVEATLLPFDGLITYGMGLSSYSIEIGPNMRKSLAEDAATCRAEGRIATTERQFLQMAPVAKESALQHAAEDFAHKTELEMNAHELAADQHEGALVGLDPEERERAVSEHIRETFLTPERRHELILEQLHDECIGATPARTLEALMNHLDKDMLLDAAERFGAKGVTPKLGKRRLAHLVAEAAPKDAEALAGSAILEGPKEVEDLRRVYEAGGSVTVPEADIQKADDVPGQHFPATSISYANGSFTCTMVAEAMEAFKDYGWDAALEQARSYERAARITEAAVEFRGVVDLVDLVGEVLREVDNDIDPFTFVSLLSDRNRREKVCYDLVPLEEGAVLAHFQLLHLDENRLYRDDFELDEDEAGILYGILDAQASKAPRPVAEIVDELGTLDAAYDWTMRQPAARELTAYLDAHVPNGEDDYTFADAIIERCYDILRAGGQVPACLDVLADRGFMPTEAQLNHLLTLLSNFANNLPQWRNNGWTPMETMAGLAELDADHVGEEDLDSLLESMDPELLEQLGLDELDFDEEDDQQL